ncbi:MAG: PTS sugar transporter subunit IIA [Planctomycetaceae bacterium]|nr:PTS sugar transporter subunit IIA [Planctomycetaceae bacterium]
MSDGDFDLAGLADYLHLDLSIVSRLVERGKLPGRRVGGVWRFSRSEIHHWLENRIGESDAPELERIGGALERQVQSNEEPLLTLAQLLVPAAIEIPLTARTRNSVITSMVELAERTGWLWDPVAMAEAVRSREDMFSTALDNGVALLHPRRPMPMILAQPFLALGVNDSPIPFASSRGVMTDIFFLIQSMTDRGHLHTLARLSRLLSDPGFIDNLRHCPDPHAAHELVANREAALLGES